MEKPSLVPEFDGSLPIHEHIDHLQKLIKEHQTVILCGETGSGKTTQIPKICLSLGFGQTKMIGCTQPRRLAARSVAQRLAEELHTEVGAGVGTKIRFQDRVNAKLTSIKIMTDGILLAEIHHDPLLLAYDVIIIDEAHERSLNIDFLLGYLKNLLKKRSDLKLIITSATIETQKFSDFFNNAPIIEVSGRSYPVDIRYRPELIDEEDEPEETSKGHLLKIIDDLLVETHQGDILVFLPGEREIRDTLDSLKGHQPHHTDIIPLFARLSQEEQDKIFKASNKRRIVLSTNVAETSLTVPGIRYVVDSGLVRIKRFSQRSKIDQLLIEKNSQASAKQRAGRSGRVAPGICVRLYSEDDYLQRPEFTTPEILRSSLATVLLKMAALKLGAIEDFPFIDPPSSRAIDNGRLELLELGALDQQLQLTPIGQKMSRIPLDPHLARILIAAEEQHAVTEALIITSFLSIQDPRERPFEFRQQADQQHKLFSHPQSDFLTVITLWQRYLEQLNKSKRQRINWCREHFLSFKRMREWHELHHQIKQIGQGFNILPQEKEATFEQLHRALLSGFISHIGYWHTEHEHYQGLRSIRFKLNKTSTLANKKSKWIMAAEIVDIGNLQARIIGPIQSQWVESYAKNLMNYSLTPGEWDSKQGQAIAFESATLYGLPIIHRRRVSLTQRNPEEAHTLLLRHLCVLEDYEGKIPEFIHKNKETIERVAQLEHKTRRQDVLIDEEAIVDMYRQFIPSHITKAQELINWYQHLPTKDKQQLIFTENQLKKQTTVTVMESLYPDEIQIQEQSYKLHYRFDPGHPLDGVTISIPLVLLGSLTDAKLQWLVPGLIREKIHFLIKGLPAQIRRSLVPLPQFITRFLSEYSDKDGSLLECLTQFIAKHYQHKVTLDDWPQLPPHLLMNISVIDTDSNEVTQSRHLTDLKAELHSLLEIHKQELNHPLLELPEIRSWNFGDLPETITVVKNNLSITLYPALTNENNRLFIRGFDDPLTAKKQMRDGLLLLIQQHLKPWLSTLVKNLSSSKEIALLLSKISSPPTAQAESWLRDEWLILLLTECLNQQQQQINTEGQFNQLCQFVRSHLSTLINQLNDIHRRIYQSLSQTLTLFSNLNKPAFKISADDIKNEIMRYFSWTIWREFSLAEITMIPRYLEALNTRIQRCILDRQQDLDKLKLIQPYATRLNNYLNKYGESADTQHFRKMLEEYKISVFAQPMKTLFPISAQRLEKFWKEHLT